jgi:uncharacterized protein (TIGR03086 family)
MNPAMNPLEDLAATAALMNDVLGRLRPGTHADLPTPCAGWTVHDLVVHVCENPFSFLTWAGADTTPAADGPPTARHAEVMQRLLAAYSAPAMLEKPLPTPFGDLPGGPVLAVCFADQLTHVWDLSRALGASVDVPAELAEHALGVWQGFITDDLRAAGAFGKAEEPGPAASPLDRLAAFTGRSL